MRAVQHSLPFTAIPAKMLTQAIFFVVKLLNYFPAKGGVSTQYSPETIMSGQTLNYKQCSLPFGTYCQVHEEDGPRNSLVARTSGAISVGPSSNRQGGHLFMSLNTGRILARRSWTVVPMPQSVIDRVNSMAADQPFLDRHGNEIMDNGEVTLPEAAPALKIPGVIKHGAQITGVDDGAPTAGVDTEIETESEVAPEDAKIQDASDNDLTNMPAPPEVDTTESNDMMEANTPTFESTDEPESKEAPTPEATPAPPTATKRERPSRIRKQVQSYVPSMTGKSYQFAATQIAYKEMLQHVPSEVV